MNQEKSDKLNEALLLCAIHSERMNFAISSLLISGNKRNPTL
jgi:hypothetical protein